MSANPEDISRSHRFNLHHQLMCTNESLRFIVSSRVQITSVSYDLIRKLRNDMLSLVSGPAVESFPEISEEATAADLLVLVSAMLGTSNSFLTDSEVKSIAEKAAIWIGTVAQAKQVIS